MTRVIPNPNLRLPVLSRPLALNHHPTLIPEFTTGLHRCGRSRPLLPSSCQVIKQSLVRELVNAKLIMLSDARGAIGTKTRIGS
jgi:hypothetical protein